jgi:hypothetical protein
MRRRVAGLLLTASLLTGCGATAHPAAGRLADQVPSDVLGLLTVAPGSLTGLPGYGAIARAVTERLGLLTGTGRGFGRAVRPWATGRAALAVLPVSGVSAALLVLIGERNPAAATAFLRRHAAASWPLRGTRLTVYQLTGGLEAALVPGEVLLGNRAAVHAALRVAAGRAAPLGVLPAYARVAPRGALTAYAPGVGFAALLDGRRGPLGALAALTVAPGLRAVALGLRRTRGGVAAQLTTLGSPGGTGQSPPVLSGALLPASVALMVSGRDLPRLAPRLLAAAGALGFGGALRRALGTVQGSGIPFAPLLARFRGPSLVAVTGDGGLLVAARAGDPRTARLALARVAGPLSALLPRGAAAVPLVSTRLQDGVEVTSLGPNLQAAVFQGLIVATTSPPTLAAMLARRPALVATPAFRSVLPAAPAGGSALVFANFGRLLPLIAADGRPDLAGLGPLADALARVRAIGLRETAHDDTTTAELQVTIR